MFSKIKWQQYLSFSFVGCIGFVVDAGALYLLINFFSFHPVTGRPLSFLVAATVTWLLNRHLTFKHGKNAVIIYEWLRYIFANSIGTVVNFAAYSALVLSLHAMMKQPIYALIIASLVAFPFNYYGYKRHVFKIA